MMYDWNINEWGKQEIYEEWRGDSLLVSIVRVLLRPFKTLYTVFVAYREETLRKMTYNSQVIVLENMLNDVFDETLRRIRVITIYDILQPPYIYTAAEDEPLYVYTAAEYNANPSLQRVYLHQNNELGVIYDFIVEAAPGSLTVEQIIRLKSLVNYYKLAGKKPYYRYSNLQPF